MTHTRPATDSDVEAIAALLPDLGYQAQPEQVRQRLARLAQWPQQWVHVAEQSGQIVGLCHAQGVPLMASDGYVEVQALVVAHTHQRRGIGRLLVADARQWALQQGTTRIRLRSGLHRDDAHRFYEAIGFEKKRASFGFEWVSR